MAREKTLPSHVTAERYERERGCCRSRACFASKHQSFASHHCDYNQRATHCELTEQVVVKEKFEARVWVSCTRRWRRHLHEWHFWPSARSRHWLVGCGGRVLPLHRADFDVERLRDTRRWCGGDCSCLDYLRQMRWPLSISLCTCMHGTSDQSEPCASTQKWRPLRSLDRAGVCFWYLRTLE